MCRDPSSWEHVPRISWWHVARVTIRITPHSDTQDAPHIRTASRKFKRHLQTQTSGRIAQYIRMTNIGYPDMIVRIIDWSKAGLTRYQQQPAMAHISPSAEWEDKMKWQQVTSHDHFTWSPTTISDSCITYYDLCQSSLGWWWPCHHLVSSWQHKISSHH